MPAKDTVFVWDGRKINGVMTNAGSYIAQIDGMNYNITLSNDTTPPVITNYSISTPVFVPQKAETVAIKYLTEEYCEFVKIEIINSEKNKRKKLC